MSTQCPPKWQGIGGDNAPDPFEDRPPVDTRHPRNRSAVTNGKRLFIYGDANSAWSRRWNDLVLAHVADMGGRDRLSEAEVSLIKRASAIELELERMEGKLSMGQEIDLGVFTASASHLRRIFETLGIQRRARDVTPPSLQHYMANAAKLEAAAE
jgi:hypothetical protein